jgi:hypothetical protein
VSVQSRGLRHPCRFRVPNGAELAGKVLATWMSRGIGGEPSLRPIEDTLAGR